MSKGLSPYEQVRRAAWEANVTINKLCQETGVPHATVSRWKHGHSEGTFHTLNKLLAKAAELRLSNPFTQ